MSFHWLNKAEFIKQLCITKSVQRLSVNTVKLCSLEFRFRFKVEFYHLPFISFIWEDPWSTRPHWETKMIAVPVFSCIVKFMFIEYHEFHWVLMQNWVLKQTSDTKPVRADVHYTGEQGDCREPPETRLNPIVNPLIQYIQYNTLDKVMCESLASELDERRTWPKLFSGADWSVNP